MKANKIKFWARIGQIAWWIYIFCSAALEMQYVTFQSAGTMARILAFCSLVFSLIFTETLVRLIG